ncbi:MAG TPA: energy transducer TonB [Thermoanaerobaculia bacterium]|jgi:hypothetical protein
MFDDVLIESAGKDKEKGGWVTAVISLVVHAAIIGALIAAGIYVKDHPEVIEKPMSAFIVASAPPPPPPLGLDQAALNAVRQWKFKPGTLNGQPVPVYYNLTVNFRIE